MSTIINQQLFAALREEVKDFLNRGPVLEVDGAQLETKVIEDLIRKEEFIYRLARQLAIASVDHEFYHEALLRQTAALIRLELAKATIAKNTTNFTLLEERHQGRSVKLAKFIRVIRPDINTNIPSTHADDNRGSLIPPQEVTPPNPSTSPWVPVPQSPEYTREELHAFREAVWVEEIMKLKFMAMMNGDASDESSSASSSGQEYFSAGIERSTDPVVEAPPAYGLGTVELPVFSNGAEQVQIAVVESSSSQATVAESNPSQADAVTSAPATSSDDSWLDNWPVFDPENRVHRSARAQTPPTDSAQQVPLVEEAVYVPTELEYTSLGGHLGDHYSDTPIRVSNLAQLRLTAVDDEQRRLNDNVVRDRLMADRQAANNRQARPPIVLPFPNNYNGFTCNARLWEARIAKLAVYLGVPAESDSAVVLAFLLRNQLVFQRLLDPEHHGHYAQRVSAQSKSVDQEMRFVRASTVGLAAAREAKLIFVQFDWSSAFVYLNQVGIDSSRYRAPQQPAPQAVVVDDGGDDDEEVPMHSIMTRTEVAAPVIPHGVYDPVTGRRNLRPSSLSRSPMVNRS